MNLTYAQMRSTASATPPRHILLLRLSDLVFGRHYLAGKYIEAALDGSAVPAAWEATPQEQRLTFLNSLEGLAGSPLRAFQEDVQWTPQQWLAFGSIAKERTLSAENLMPQDAVKRLTQSSTAGFMAHSDIALFALCKEQDLQDITTHLQTLTGVALAICGVPQCAIASGTLAQLTELDMDYLLQSFG